MKTLIVLMVLVGLSSEVWAAPVKVPPLKICASAAGAVTAKKKCAKTETQLTLEALQGAPGATGATGPAGKDGALSFDGCRWVTQQVADTYNTWVLVECAEGEIMLSHGIAKSSGADFVVREIRLQAWAEAPQEPSGVEYQIDSPDGDSYVAVGQAYCCPR